MRIYTMTATFGKLENQTLRLTPGLNVIHAPNEWGKSTWCAFLVAMLYGIDTRERTKQGALADKERYAPWSGSPMSGRMEISWNGRDITLERSTKGRSPMGEFKAYETASGLPVAELTGENCGQQLLGVEKSVFTRSGFLRLTDLPVTEDDALRRRLNALVTTGDESGESDDLAQKLKQLKNRCRHNRTGLLPQAEAQRNEISTALQHLHTLQQEHALLSREQETIHETLDRLENHRAALAHTQAMADRRLVEDAFEARDTAQHHYEALLAEFGDLPDRDTAENQILHLEQLRIQQDALSQQPLPPMPQAPETPADFVGLSPRQALAQAIKDRESYSKLSQKKAPLLPILASICAIGAVAFLLLIHWIAALAPIVLAICLAGSWLYGKKKTGAKIAAITARYQKTDPDSWVAAAEQWLQETATYEKAYADYRRLCEEYNSGKAALLDNVENCTGGLTVAQAIDYWRQVLENHRQLEYGQQALYQAEQHAQTLAGMAKPVAAPAFPDTLTLDSQETDHQIRQLQARLHQLQTLTGQLSGKMDALGQESRLTQQLEDVNTRIRKLEDIYEATTLAMEFLEQAASNLQRKFAPRIAQRAGDIFSGLTDGRYKQLVLGDDLSLAVAAQGETVTRSSLWRSDGTADQLYLALRLAVSEELTPHAPLVLDDALVRFDDTRLALAMDILKEIAESKQVLLFTCQKRETAYL